MIAYSRSRPGSDLYSVRESSSTSIELIGAVSFFFRSGWGGGFYIRHNKDIPRPETRQKSQEKETRNYCLYAAVSDGPTLGHARMKKWGL